MLVAVAAWARGRGRKVIVYSSAQLPYTARSFDDLCYSPRLITKLDTTGSYHYFSLLGPTTLIES
jgi:hypothetical protein